MTATSSASQPLCGDVHVAGDKSISHRALMLASQALGLTTISGLLEGEDVMNTAAALKSMGVNIEKNGSQWRVEGVGIGGLQEPQGVLDMGNSGTSTRLLMGLVTPYPFTSFFTGDDSLRSRPMARVITPLEQVGAQITTHSGGRLPLSVKGTDTPNAISYTLPVASAQVKSAIILAALNTPGTTTVIEPHATRDHTENMLEYFDIPITRGQTKDGTNITLTGRPKQTAKNRDIEVPGDPSSAAFLLVAALIVPGSNVIVRNICMNPLRTGLFTTLKEMGADLSYENERTLGGEKLADIRVRYSALKAVNVPAERAPSMIDEYPILAVAAAFAKGESVMHGLSELRVKESDRLNAITESLTGCGVTARAEGDTLYVTGGVPKGGTTIATRLDHRIAMSFLVMGMASKEPVIIDDASAINTSFPNFISLMNGLGASIATDRVPSTEYRVPLVITIDGPAASGKGTLARRLAEHFGMAYLDTGSLYRAVGLKLVYSDKDPNDKEAALKAARSIDTNDLSNPRLRQERIGKAASIVSAFPEVRQALLDYQREFAKTPNGAVLDGRDIGTVVCPDAPIKFFITATLFARAKRRHRELSGEGIEVVFDSVLEDLRERDERDQNRAAAPLVPADDAIIIDSSAADASEIFQRAREIVELRKVSAS
ncbi:MAG: 3-phosphoshikimate 1-carboxyvinyltransferase [Alphaproteobacteria bacterium]|nr:3-phosphoshikimate 1-carboxyvinyltransferase [Alphaproteobacteria bacterium]